MADNWGDSAGSKGVNPFLGSDDEDNEDCWLDSSGKDREEEEEEFKYDGPKFHFMNCWRCKSFCRSPVYFCSKGHVFCYRCAADYEFCSSCHLSEKIRLRNILPYDMEFSFKKLVRCSRYQLGCVRQIHPNSYLDHFQSQCSYRGAIKCFLNGCEPKPAKIYWGFIDAHMKSSHGSAKKDLSGTSRGKFLEIPYGDLKEGIIMTPVVFDVGKVRKFIPAIKKTADRVYFWIYMIENGYIHDYQYSQFHAKIKVHLVEDLESSQSNVYEGILEPVRKLEKNIEVELKGVDLDVADFEKSCLIQTIKNDSYFVVEFGIEERVIVTQTKTPECDCNGYGDFPANLEADFDAAMKKISIRDIIFPNDIKLDYEIPEKVQRNLKDILEKREELVKMRIREEYQKYVDGPKPEFAYELFRESFPDKTPTEEQKKETALVDKHRKAAVESGKLEQGDILRLENNFMWTAADVAILESEGRKGFFRLPTVQSGIYFTDFLKNQMEAFLSAQQEKYLLSIPKRGSLFFL